MHQRSQQSKSKSVHFSEIDKGNPSKTTGKFNRKNNRNIHQNMPYRGSARSSITRKVFSWLGSFIQLFFIIGFFVFVVYIYDERIIYGFAREAGWGFQNKQSARESNNLEVGKQFENEADIVMHHETKIEDRPSPINQDASRSNVKSAVVEESTGNLPDVETVFQHFVLQVLTNTHQKPQFKIRFDVCTRSLLTKSSIDLHFYFVVDKPSKEFIMECLQQITDEGISRSKFQFTFLDIEDLGHKLLPHVGDLQAHLKGHHPYYHDAIFYLSLGIHQQILPKDVKQLVIMDTDLKFMSDIKDLFGLFDDFEEHNVMGIAHEQQPVYRHLFSLYRSQNRGTTVGDPPPNGLTGFNSGVMLLDFEKMRASQAYQETLDVDFIKKYSDKYHFKGHLGDQDFFTLVSMEKSELFYILPCSWNKQLCVWWKDKGYQDVFDSYYTCAEPIHVYHGNCNTEIPY